MSTRLWTVKKVAESLGAAAEIFYEARLDTGRDRTLSADEAEVIAALTDNLLACVDALALHVEAQP